MSATTTEPVAGRARRKHPVDTILPVPQLALYGFQHVLAFYAGVVMELSGLSRSLFTPTFAAARAVGWCAHILEQAADDRIIRPSARYVGPPAPQPR